LRTTLTPFPGFGKAASGRERAMLYRLGRALQLTGMIILPLAIVAQIAPERAIDLKTSLTLSGVGVLVFFVGWLIQQAGRRR
jgi:hypothetical protein